MKRTGRPARLLVRLRKLTRNDQIILSLLAVVAGAVVAYGSLAFRWLIGTHGTPLDIPNVCQIRHIVKGRYNKDSFFTKVRKFIRKSQDQ